MKTEIKYYCEHCGRKIECGDTFAMIEETLYTIDKHGDLYKSPTIDNKDVFCINCHSKIMKLDDKFNELLETADEYLKVKR